MSQIYALREMARSFKREEGDRLLFPMHAVRLLCAAQKDRGSDEAKAWMKVTIPHAPSPLLCGRTRTVLVCVWQGLDGAGRTEEILPTIPDYAYDKHTKEGQALGRGDRHFLVSRTIMARIFRHRTVFQLRNDRAGRSMLRSSSRRRRGAI